MKITRPDYLVIGILFTVLLLGGCGGGSKDSPGITASATITPTYNGVNTSSVDAFQNYCTSGTGSTTQLEYFADHSATAAISARLINPNNITDEMTVYIDRYTINYSSHADSPGAPPILADSREGTLSFVISGSTSTAAAMTVSLVDLKRKDTYHSDVTSGGSSAILNNYTATYAFEGHSGNGVGFTITATTDFQIGSFNNCPAGTNPQ